MLSTSFAFRRYVAGGRHLANKVELTFADGATKTLFGDDLVMGGVSFSNASSSLNSFDVGSAIIGTASLSLANHDEQWNDYDFTGATCVVSLGAALGDDTVEWLRKGTYGVVQPELYDSTIELDCMDNMRLFQVPYSTVMTSYPATLQAIVTDICAACGVSMLSAGFPHDSQVVPARPDDDSLSCLDVLSWAAQMAGCFCDVDTWGRLRVRWYDTGAYETEDWLDGGTFGTETTPYSDGDDADGGYFHGGGDDADGGDFAQTPWAVVSAIKSLSTATDDVVITGVRVTASDEVKADGTSGEKGESHLYGTEGYVISIEGNALVAYGHAQSVATTIGPSIVGMRFRPLTVTSIGDPAIEAGDPMLVIDRRQRTYRSWVTSNTWKQGGYQSLACSAETPARNSADSHSAITRAIVQQRNAMRAEMTARELAVSQLARELSEASGLYKTEQEQQDHSVIYYLHDKPTLAESQIVWKMNSAAFAVSVDGGTTYPFGFDAWGNAILNAIYAIGIEATYIHGGTLTLGGSNNGNGVMQVLDASNNVIGSWSNTGLSATGALKMVSRGIASSAKSYADIGQFSWSGWIYGSRNTSGKTVYGLRLHTTGENTDGDLIVTSKAPTGSTTGNYGASAILSKGPLCLSAAAGELSDNPHINIGQDQNGTYQNVVIDSGISSSGSWHHGIVVSDSDITLMGNANYLLKAKATNTAGYDGEVRVGVDFTVNGHKSRLVETDTYGDRLLYCYESPQPFFGDVGGGTIGEDGTCYVNIDDVFSETVRCDLSYHVFLQVYGDGNAWVSERTPTHFVVCGTPGLEFAWEMKARQVNYETTRLEDHGVVEWIGEEGSYGLNIDVVYGDELAYIEEMERLYDEEAA